ncbi:MAG: glycosyltransferase [Rhodothermales bacterium]
MKRVCIQWPRFGPYHMVRLEAAHHYFQQHQTELIGLETASRDATYAWRTEPDRAQFRREQIFPNRSLEQLTPAEIYAGVTTTLDRLAPDAVAINSYSYPDALACLDWCRRHRRVAVVMTDSKEDDAPRIAWRERVKALLISQFDAALLAGTPHRAYFEKLGFPNDAVFLGYDVVDNAFFRERAADAREHPERYRHLPGLASDLPFFLTSSRFVPRKNLDGLLAAYHAYRAGTAHPWRLVILGDGPERARLDALLHTERIENVTLAGFRQLEELPAYYGLAGAFVHPARIDQWGLVVNEAMAAGLPVLVSERAGCAHDLVLEGENGYRFPPENTDRLARLMQQMTSAQTDRAAMGRRSQAIIAGWSPEHFAEKLAQAFQEGRKRAGRPFRPAPRLVLWTLRKTARSVQSFHAIRE